MSEKAMLEYWGNPTFPAKVDFVNCLSVNGYAPDSVVFSGTVDSIEELDAAVTRLNTVLEEGIEGGEKSLWGNQRKICRETIMHLCRRLGKLALNDDKEGLRPLTFDLVFVSSALVSLEIGNDFTEKSEAELHRIRECYGLPRVTLITGTGAMP